MPQSRRRSRRNCSQSEAPGVSFSRSLLLAIFVERIAEPGADRERGPGTDVMHERSDPGGGTEIRFWVWIIVTPSRQKSFLI